MTSSSDFQDYLQSLCTTYEQWWKENAFIEEIKDTWFEFVLDGKTKSDKPTDDHKVASGQPQETTKPVLSLIEDYRHQKILVVGSPGAGKSTLLKRLLRDAAQKAQNDEQAPIPIFVELKDYKTMGDRAGVRGLILENLESHDPALDEEALKRLLAGKRLLLLADGLNELSHEAAKADLKNLCRHQAVIATSRSTNDWWDIDRKLEIQPLTPQQVKQFFEERLPNRDRAEVEQLGDRVRDFGQTPLMVWMLYIIFQANKETPTTRGEAYRSFTALYVERAKAGIDLAEPRFFLSKLAFEMMQSQKPDDPTHFSLDMTEVEAQNRLGSEAILNRLLNLHLLQASGNPGNRKIRFCHQTLQEYYAAEALLERLQKHSEWLEKTPEQEWTRFQQDYLNYLKWTEAIALMLGLPELENQTEKLIELAWGTDLKLGARLAGEVQPSVQEATVNIIIDKKFTPTLTIWLLEQSRSLNALPYLFNVLNNGCSDTRWRAARALGNSSDTLVLTNLAKALKDPNSSVRRKAAEALGKLGNSDVVSHLCPLLNDEDWLVRSFVVNIIGELEAAESVECLKHGLEHDNSSIRNKATEYLGKLAPQVVISLLSEKFVSGDTGTKRDVVNLLHRTKTSEAIPVLIQALSDNDWIVRSNAASQIGLLGIWLDKNLLEDALTELIYILQTDPEISVRSSAAISLGMIGNSRIVSALIEALSQEDPVVRISVINSLGRLRDPAAIHPLIDSLEDDDYVCEAAIKVCEATIKALRALNAAEALPKIRKLSQSKVIKIRREALFTLGFIGDSKEIPSLYKALQKNETFPIRLCAAHSLSLLNNRKGVAILEDTLETRNKEARELALDGLKNFKGKVGLSSILSRAFKDEEFSIRRDSIDFLNSFREYPEVTKQLTNALNSSNETICRNAMDAAKTLGNAENLLSLRHLAETITVVERPLEAIAAIQSRCGFYNYDIAQAKFSQGLESRIRKDLIYDKLDTLTQEVKKVSEEPKRVIHTENYFEKGTHTHTHNYANDEALRQEITDLRQLVSQLQQNRQPTTEAEAIQIIDAEFRAMPKTNPNRWQTIQKQLRLLKRQLLDPERHLTASKAAIAEVAKHYLEDSVLAKALITYVDTMSADADQGE
jgi:HEAT repeat protein/uridine kinase